MRNELDDVKDILDILRSQREKIIDDYLPNDCNEYDRYSPKDDDLFDSFTKSERIDRDLFAEKYRLKWLYAHWEKAQDRINDIGSEDQRMRFLSLFVRSIMPLIETFEKYPEASGQFIEKMIKQRQYINSELIDLNEDSCMKIRNIQLQLRYDDYVDNKNIKQRRKKS